MDGQMTKSKNPFPIYPRQLKKKIAREVVLGEKGMTEASRDYNISFGSIFRWTKQFREAIMEEKAKEDVISSLMKKPKKNQEEADLPSELQSLKEENMQLRKKLFESNLKTEALSTLIDLAEEHYGIPVRKNSGAKQSND
jgi:transposase-like protein